MVTTKRGATTAAPSTPTVEFRVLGIVEHGDPRSPTPLGGPLQKAVLAMLLRAGGSVVPDDSIVDGVWADNPPGSVKQSLHTYISNLRASLGGRIERSGNGYRLEVEPEDIDCNRFERITDAARSTLSANPESAAHELRLALALWRGRPYADLVDIPGLQDEIRRLEELRVLAVESRIDADLAAGRHSVVIGEIEALATEYPLREGFRARHMIALYRDGRQAEALRAYQQTRDHLADELGVEPSSELQDLEDRILQHDSTLMSSRDVRTETVAFLFTDIEASTSLWETKPEQMRDALAVHDGILNKVIDDTGGRVFKHTGDGILAAFGTVEAAARAAVLAQERFSERDWGTIGALAVKMSVDVGEVDARAGDYFGAPLNRGARLVSAAHGGQILLSEPANHILQRQAGVQIRSLGEHRFKGLGSPQPVYQLVGPNLPEEFPALRIQDPVSAAGRQFGDAIRGYEIRERIGEGRFGSVYRAYQPAVGREVAVKVIRSEFADHPGFLRTFETEARLVAKMAHPHIVPIFDFWRDHQGAYLVMPYLAGTSLASIDGTLSLDRVAGIVRQVGAALSYAHRQGVIHRDVKPANVLLDAEGNAYLSDFGIGVRAIERATGILPAISIHRAPESAEGSQIDERADVYSLASVAALLLTGQRPATADFSQLPAGGGVALETALATDPSRRQRSVASFIAEFTAATSAAPAVQAVPLALRNPYKGLAAFDVTDARDFFGRDQEVAELSALVAQRRFVTVVGPSGSGKSSLVRAGLIPSLRAAGAPGSTEWLTVTCVPGAHPFDELATALGEIATESMGEIAAELRSDDHGLLRTTKRLVRDIDTELLVVIDQFEELYSLVNDDATATAFVTSLIEATADPHSRLRVVATIRADFFDHPLLHDRLGALVAEAHMVLSVPGADALLEAIEGPAARAGLEFGGGLAHRIVGDIREQPGGLPLMQFMLAALVERATGGKISPNDYELLGGVVGALSKTATVVFESLSDSDRRVAQQVLLRLVQVVDESGDVRRRVRQTELESLGMDVGAIRRVLEAFGEHRLVTFDRDPITRGPTVEVAHEALLREWELLAGWIAERRDSLIVHRRLVTAITEWTRGSQRDDLLPFGTRLGQFEDWLDTTDTASTEERNFIAGAIEHRDRLAADIRHRRQLIMTSFAAVALIASVLAIFAFAQQREAETTAGLSRARELVAVADAARSRDPELGLLIALEAITQYDAIGDEIPIAALQVLRSGISDDRILTRLPGGQFVTADPNGTAIATSDGEGGIAVWDLATEERTAQFSHPRGLEVLGAIWESGPFLYALVAEPDDTFSVVGVTSEGEWRATRSVNFVLESNGRADVSADSRYFAHPQNGSIVVVDTSDGQTLFEVTADDLDSRGPIPPRIQFGLNGSTLFLATTRSDEGSDVWSFDVSEQPEFQLEGSVDFAVEDFSESPNGRLLAVTNGFEMAVIDRNDQTLLWHNAGLQRAFFPYWLSDDRLVAGGEAKFLVIDAQSGSLVRAIQANQGGARDWAHVPGTTRIASAGNSDVVLIDVGDDAGAEIERFQVPIDPWDIVASHDNDLLTVTDGPAGTTAVVNPLTGHVSTGPMSVPDSVSSIPIVSNNGRFVASTNPAGISELRTVNRDNVLYSAPPGFAIKGINDDGTNVLITDQNREAEPELLVRTSDGETLHALDGGRQLGIAPFSPDGVHVVTGDEVPHLWSTTTGTLLWEGEIIGFWSRFTPDGEMFILGGDEGQLVFYDFTAILDGSAETDPRTVPAHSTFIYRVAVSPDGTKVLSAAFSEAAKLWDVETGAQLGEFGTADAITGVGFHPTEPWVYIGVDRTVSIHTYDTDELIGIARQRLSRALTPDECDLYLLRPCDDR